MSSDGFDPRAPGKTRRAFLKAVSAGAAGMLLPLLRGSAAPVQASVSNTPDNPFSMGQHGTQRLGDGSTESDSVDPGHHTLAAQSSMVHHGRDIGPSANSITAVAGGTRTDPEGVAPTGNVYSITWNDSRNAQRTMTLGAYLYQYNFSFDDGQQVVTRSANDNAYGHAGFGYVVSHNTQTGNSPLGKSDVPSNVQPIVFSGGHHAIHRVEVVYNRDIEADGFG